MFVFDLGKFLTNLYRFWIPIPNLNATTQYVQIKLWGRSYEYKKKTKFWKLKNTYVGMLVFF